MLYWNIKPGPNIRGTKKTLAKKENARRGGVTVRLNSHSQEKPLTLKANISSQHQSRADGSVEHECDEYLESRISTNRHQDSLGDRE